MNRFFVNPTDVNEEKQQIMIEGEDVKHISKVLRLRVGDTIEICDGIKWEYIAEIQEISKDQVRASFRERFPSHREASVKVKLYQGIPKAAKMELIIQKTTEMGITEVIPVITKRTIVQLNEKDQAKKNDRWKKIAVEAAKQSKRGILPYIHQPLTFQQALSHGEANDINIIAYENEDHRGVRSILQEVKPSEPQTIGIWIGPEGGFEKEEIEAAKEKSIHSVTLGPRILRTETAGLALLSMIMYELGDLGGC